MVLLVLEKGNPSFASPKYLVITFVCCIRVSGTLCVFPQGMNTAADKHGLFSEVKKSLPNQIFPFCFIGSFSATQASLIILCSLLFWRHTGRYYLTLNPAYPMGYLSLKARKRGALNHTVERGPSACFGMKEAFLGCISS